MGTNLRSSKISTSAPFSKAKLIFTSILVLLIIQRAQADLYIKGTTPQSSSDGSPNTLVGVAGQSVASTLLDSGTPAMLWGTILPDVVNTACKAFSDGNKTIDAKVEDNWGNKGAYDVTFEFVATAGCFVAEDASGTELHVVDQATGRVCAVVCFDNTGSLGSCAVYWAGKDVENVYNSWNKSDDGTSLSVRAMKYEDCSSSSTSVSMFSKVTSVAQTLGSCMTAVGWVNPAMSTPLCAAMAIGQVLLPLIMSSLGGGCNSGGGDSRYNPSGPYRGGQNSGGPYPNSGFQNPGRPTPYYSNSGGQNQYYPNTGDQIPYYPNPGGQSQYYPNTGGQTANPFSTGQPYDSGRGRNSGNGYNQPPPDQGCFPAQAMVELESGLQLPMSMLSVGEKVAAWKSDVGIYYDEVYAFGHKDPSSMTRFVQITMEQVILLDDSSHEASTSRRIKTLDITPLHFLPMSKTIGGKVLNIRAKDIQIGDFVWATNFGFTYYQNQSMARSTGDEDRKMVVGGARENNHSRVIPHVVTSISVTFKRGMYNPFTMGGNILVGGVLASTHSDWFLDELFSTFGISSSTLPDAYQFVLFVPRLLFRLLGKQTYVAMYTWLEAHLNIVEVCANHGGSIFLASIVAFSLSMFGVLGGVMRHTSSLT